jgi:hypothetical protein
MRKSFIAIAVLTAMAAITPVSAETSGEPSPAQSPALGAITADCARENVTCRALESCAEACGFLNQCGLTRLDRDTDGIPCETLCTRPCDAQG